MKKRKFSLLEVILVIVLLGVFAGFLGPKTFEKIHASSSYTTDVKYGKKWLCEYGESGYTDLILNKWKSPFFKMELIMKNYF